MPPLARLGSAVLAALLVAPDVHADLPRASPAVVGMSARHLERIDGVVREGLEGGDMPGCVVCVGRRGRIVFLKAYGDRQVEPRRLPMTMDTVFDLASLTKPIATATSVMILVERGQVRLRDPISAHVPEFGQGGKEEITVLDLLVHQGGLVPDNALADYDDGPDEAMRRICALEAQAKPGTRFVYTDVGYIVLAELVRRVSGLDVHAFSREHLFAPLGMDETGYLPPEALRERAAPTERRAGHWMRGDVHDPRAYRLGGVAGHAGLFSTADDLAVYAQMMLDGGTYGGARILDRRTVTTMTDVYPVSSGVRGLGWDKRTGYSSNRGELLSARAFGHGGFTGTAMWIDPELELFVIFLSNRLHPDGEGNVNPLAGRIGTIAARAIGGGAGADEGADAGTGEGAGAGGDSCLPRATAHESQHAVPSPRASGERARVRGPEHPHEIQRVILHQTRSQREIAAVESAEGLTVNSSRRKTPHPNPLPASGERGPQALRSGVPPDADDDEVPGAHTHVLTGIDVLQRDGFDVLRDRRVGLITNRTGINRDGVRTAEILHDAEDVDLVALFSPEHGVSGALDRAVIPDERDAATDLPIYSLYGATRRPTAGMLAGIDTLVFDIQDIGTRFYTYISTMGEAMRAAAEHGLRFVVLDRPNPINGADVEGPVLDEGRESFTGFHTLPVRHGMTAGELARMFDGELSLGLDLHVVGVEGWRRRDYLDGTGLLWINPSPNMRSLTQAHVYPGIGLLETTNLSVGRGTDTPFEIIGAPWLDARALAAALNGSDLPGVRFVPIRFTPRSSIFAGEPCGGINIIITERRTYRPVRTGLEIARRLLELHPDEWRARDCDTLLADGATLDALLAGRTVEEMEAAHRAALDAFRRRRALYLMYE